MNETPPINIDAGKFLDIANWVGPGLAVLILAVATWALWKLAISEMAFNKAILREFLISNQQVTKSLDANTDAIESLKELIKGNQK